MKLDEFESVFKAADKKQFSLQEPTLRRLLIVADLEGEELQAFVTRVVKFAQHFGHVDSSDFSHEVITKQSYGDLGELLQRVEELSPDMVCTYRNLGSSGWKYRHSLGEDVDVLSQAVPAPTLLVPHPLAGRDAAHALVGVDNVMVVADHLTGDDRLVNFGFACTGRGGRLHLCHVEAASIFDYYMSIIEKLPDIDSEIAREGIRERLLKEPADYIQSVTNVLAEAGQKDVAIQSHVLMGHRLLEYRRLVTETTADLLVLNARDSEQIAMHPMAYPLAVELDQIPQLLV